MLINHEFYTLELQLCISLLLSDNGENLENKQEQHLAFVRMGNLSGLLPNATPLPRW
jgi:hypothetical protein